MIGKNLPCGLWQGGKPSPYPEFFVFVIVCLNVVQSGSQKLTVKKMMTSPMCFFRLRSLVQFDDISVL